MKLCDLQKLVTGLKWGMCHILLGCCSELSCKSVCKVTVSILHFSQVTLQTSHSSTVDNIHWRRRQALVLWQEWAGMRETRSWVKGLSCELSPCQWGGEHRFALLHNLHTISQVSMVHGFAHLYNVMHGPWGRQVHLVGALRSRSIWAVLSVNPNEGLSLTGGSTFPPLHWCKDSSI